MIFRTMDVVLSRQKDNSTVKLPAMNSAHVQGA